MLAAHRALAVLAALVAAASAEECSSTTTGTKTNYAIRLPDVKMPPGAKDIRVDPADECPAPSSMVGLSVKACDDVAPALSGRNTNEVVVHRLGGAGARGRIETTIYCGPPNLRGDYMLQPQPYVMAPAWPQMSKTRNVYNAPNAYNSHDAYELFPYRGLETHAHGDSHEHGVGQPGVPGVPGAVITLNPHRPYPAVLPIIYPIHHK